MSADLHIHTRCSDGSTEVERAVAYAARAGLSTIAVTDHDTMSGVERAQTAASARGIRVIPGLEITARDRSHENRPVHLLCYRPEKPEIIDAFCARTRKNRSKQKMAMAEKIREIYPLELGDVLENARGSAALHECHIMQALADLGYTNAVIGPLMRELISSSGSCYVPSRYPDIFEALEAVRASGGFAVVAHPGQFDSVALVATLARDGLIGGVEVAHPRNAPGIRAQLCEIAAEYGLLMTGGSDFHGASAQNPHPIGYCTCDESDIKILL